MADDTLQILPGIAVLAAVVSAYPVEYDDLTHFGQVPVQYPQAAPLVKQLVVEKYVSLTYGCVLLLGATKYITSNSNSKSPVYVSNKSHTTPVVYQFIHG